MGAEEYRKLADWLMMHAYYYLSGGASPPPNTFTFLIGVVVGADVRVKVMLRVSHAYRIKYHPLLKKLFNSREPTHLRMWVMLREVH